MRTISLRVKLALQDDPFMKKCCIGGMCEGRIEWHHVWIYAGSQIDEVWAIVPACKFHHDKAHLPGMNARFQKISLERANEEDLAKYPKKDWAQIKKYLISTLG